ncbi:hypothetical protein AAHW35_08885 [Klebsiella quasipneumoniae subsp. similipneumoniae]|uniref:hypothetical protein n=1 Tax=Klebsiella quasipneumoniae TaxID=1463165 RepID=UPI0035B11AF4
MMIFVQIILSIIIAAAAALLGYQQHKAGGGKAFVAMWVITCVASAANAALLILPGAHHG